MRDVAGLPSGTPFQSGSRHSVRHHRFAARTRGYALTMQQQMQPHEPIIRFDDNEVDVAAQLVPQLGYEEAERIFEMSVRTHRPVQTVIADAA